MNYKNSIEALREAETDINEGADALIIKPAMSYLDIIYRVKSKFNIPVIAYNVSGEYSIVKSATEKKWVDNNIILVHSHSKFDHRICDCAMLCPWGNVS